MGDVRIIAGVLDHAGGGGTRLRAGERKRKRGGLAARQRHLDRINKLAGHERAERRLGGRGGAGSGGPASAQGPILLGHSPGYNMAGDIR